MQHAPWAGAQLGAMGQRFPDAREGSRAWPACLALPGSGPAAGGSAVDMPGLRTLHVLLVRGESYVGGQRRAAGALSEVKQCPLNMAGDTSGVGTALKRDQNHQRLVLPTPCSNAFCGADTSFSRTARQD